LRSYQRNKIAIDTTKLPVDADISTTEGYVNPADRAGVRLNFAVQDQCPAPIVVFKVRRPAAPAGARGQIEGGESFAVGYDGPRLHQRASMPRNKATITWSIANVTRRSATEARPNEQVVISDVNLPVSDEPVQ